MRGVIVNILWFFKKSPSQNAILVAIKWGGIIKNFKKFSKSLHFWCRFVDYQLREFYAFISYISRLKSRRKLPPGKEKNGLRLAARRCDVEWDFSQTIDACRASVTLSKHCLCHYNGAWLAFVSFTLSKHWICNDKSLCMSVRHSQQALLLSIQMCSLRVCDS